MADTTASPIATLELPGRWDGGPVFSSVVSGDHVYVGTGGGIRALRIGQVGSASWKEVVSIAIPGVIRELDASGNYLYVSDPLQPIEVGHHEMPGMACS